MFFFISVGLYTVLKAYRARSACKYIEDWQQTISLREIVLEIGKDIEAGAEAEQ